MYPTARGIADGHLDFWEIFGHGRIIFFIARIKIGFNSANYLRAFHERGGRKYIVEKNPEFKTRIGKRYIYLS